MASSRTTGRAGEFLAAFFFEMHGVQCHHVDRDGVDLIGMFDDGRPPVSIQVKSTSGRYNRSDGSGRLEKKYRFNVQGARTYDYVAFVSLDLMTMVVYPKEAIASRHTFLVSVDEFTEENMKATIEKMLQG